MNSLTILGCGTSTGVPVIGCKCPVCRSRHPRNHRLRAAAWFQVQGKSILVDTSVDLRQQALKHRIGKVDAVLFTHPHADHVHGIDEVRAYNFLQKEPIPAFGNAWTCHELREKFSYIFQPGPVEGGGIPRLDLTQFDGGVPELQVAEIPVIPISHRHGSKECIGYRINSVAYVTDCSYIPPQSLDRMKGLSVLVLDCLRRQLHGTHFNLDQSLETAARLRPGKTILTHLSHDFDYTKTKLPKGVSLAYDGLSIKF